MPLRTLDPFRPTHSTLTPHRAAPVAPQHTAPRPASRLPVGARTAPPPSPRSAPPPRPAPRCPRRRSHRAAPVVAPQRAAPVAPHHAGPSTAPSPPRTAPAHAREGLASVSLDSLAPSDRDAEVRKEGHEIPNRKLLQRMFGDENAEAKILNQKHDLLTARPIEEAYQQQIQSLEVKLSTINEEWKGKRGIEKQPFHSPDFIAETMALNFWIM
ncbi:vegetative cell wall protein gp1-like [Setaria italica]|uniref:vegetative cell wall protein gp1-like n=1 Tax=Setaria italica TaxID=4555 RepID=UPI0006485FD3|nr:vegetative cell wall protein gp1-like [Setaria italica]